CLPRVRREGVGGRLSLRARRGRARTEDEETEEGDDEPHGDLRGAPPSQAVAVATVTPSPTSAPFRDLGLATIRGVTHVPSRSGGRRAIRRSAADRARAAQGSAHRPTKRQIQRGWVGVDSPQIRVTTPSLRSWRTILIVSASGIAQTSRSSSIVLLPS